MRRALLPVLLVLLPVQAASAAASPSFARVTGALPARQHGAPVQTRPDRFKAFRLRRAAARKALADAPLERRRGARRSSTVFAIPSPSGAPMRFRAVESPVMAPALARSHPAIHTYAGVSVDDPTATARFDLTPAGFHASVRDRSGSWYVDPYYAGRDEVHVAYYGRDLDDGHGPLTEAPVTGHAGSTASSARSAGAQVVQRVYRLALLTDPSYAAFFADQGTTVAQANATLINRVNQIYNDDLAVKLELIAGNDELDLDSAAEFSEPDGPCGVQACFPTETVNCTDPTLERNQAAIDAIVGSANYDVGHLSVAAGGGGAARVGAVGRDAYKAQGCTGIEKPTGDFYAVDFVAHELGHQFGANHTYASCGDDPGIPASAVEPGSGSSIMAYAGICGEDDLQEHSDPYFSQRSLDEIDDYVTSDPARGGDEVPVANSAPIVAAPAAATIPPRTPFTLTGSAVDPDADQAPVFLWEQNDAGAAGALLSDAKPAGPLFRVFPDYSEVAHAATDMDSTRTFPDLAQVAAGTTNALTGSCSAMLAGADQRDCYSEFLPTTAGRKLHFRLTARDRFLSGGGVDHADVTLTTAGTQPFRVTAPASAGPATGHTYVPITWNVAGTSAPPVSVPTVRITYSTDGGLTFPAVLKAATPNDGSEPVFLPNEDTATGRFRVEAVGNVFFDISHADLTVTPGDPEATPTPEPVVTPTVTPAPTPSATTTATATATATASAAPTPSPRRPKDARPRAAALRPVLAKTKRRLRVSRKRRVAVRVRCAVVGNGTPPTTCRGRVALIVPSGRTVRRSFTVAPERTRRVRLTLRRRPYRRLRHQRRLKATVRASVGERTVRKKVRLRRA